MRKVGHSAVARRDTDQRGFSSGVLCHVPWLTLDVANTSAGVALFGSDCPRVGASGGLVSGLSAVVAETLVRGAVLRDVAN